MYQGLPAFFILSCFVQKIVLNTVSEAYRHDTPIFYNNFLNHG